MFCEIADKLIGCVVNHFSNTVHKSLASDNALCSISLTIPYMQSISFNPQFFLQKFFIIILGFLLVCNQPLLEKRLLYERQDNFETSTDWYVDINETFLDSGVALGFNKEYCPQVFFDANYESKYENSLYSFVKSRIRYDFYNYEDYSNIGRYL